MTGIRPRESRLQCAVWRRGGEFFVAEKGLERRNVVIFWPRAVCLFVFGKRRTEVSRFPDLKGTWVVVRNGEVGNGTPVVVRKAPSGGEGGECCDVGVIDGRGWLESGD